jgi:hypothetical protein
MQQMIDSGVAESALEDCTLKHYFTDKKQGKFEVHAFNID